MRDSDWIYLGLFFLALFGTVGLAELIRRWRSWSSEATRKSVHILVGLLVATTPFVLYSRWPMVFLGVIFILIDYIAVKKDVFTVMHGTKRRTFGTVFYPLSFVLLVLLLWDRDRLVLIVSMLIMAISDAAAAIVGERLKNPIALTLGPEKKSLQGSVAMFISTFLIVTGSLVILGTHFYGEAIIGKALWIGLIVAAVATVCEAVSLRGSDNLTVPLGSAFVMYYLVHHETEDIVMFGVGMGLALIVITGSYRLGFLDGGGAAVAFLLGTLVFGIGRWMFTIPILIFFVLSSILSAVGKNRKKGIHSVFEKTGCRDLWQVLANGGIPGLVLIIWYFYPDDIFFIFFLGALAGVTADTWGTEIGILSGEKPRSIVTFKRVPAGTSGGITCLGTTGSAAGALLLAGAGMWASRFSSPPAVGWTEFFMISSAGLLASLVDSLLGATVQAQYRCGVCEKITEKRLHCGDHRTDFIRGYTRINNDVVNALCGLSGVFFSWIGWLIVK